MEEHWFGIRPPAKVTTKWGCRAIFKRGDIDIVWDRISKRGQNDKLKALCAWLDKTGLKLLRKEMQRKPDQMSREETRIEADGYVIVASPKASAGYLYIGAWPCEEEG